MELIVHSDFGLSAQVLQEFYVNITRKIATPLAPDSAVALLEEFRCFPMVLTDDPLIVAGVEVSLRFEISFWDGTIIAAASRLGATTLYTEDLSHGRHYGSVRAVNPFVPATSDNVDEARGLKHG